MTNERWIATPFSHIRSRPQKWVFEPFIPQGLITNVAGPGGVGKSTMILDLIGRITTGEPMPHFGDDLPQTTRTGSVMILCNEDDASLIIRPRLQAAKADMDKVRFLTEADGGLIAGLDTGTQELERLVEEIKDVRLILIDPITAFFGKLSFNRDDQVRRLLTPLTRLAADFNLAIVNVIHVSKNPQMKGTGRILGGVGLINAARATLFVSAIEGSNKRLLITARSTVAPGGVRRSVAFTMNDVNGQAEIRWGADYEDVDVEQTLSGKTAHVTKQQQAASWLRQWLADSPLPSREIERRSNERGVHFNTVKAAKKEIGVKSLKRDDGWWWELPPDDKGTSAQGDNADPTIH
jgi:GTPase SAR1 family protein